MKKRAIFLLVPVVLVSLSGCKKKKAKEETIDPSVYTLSYKETNGKYYIEVSKYNHTFNTINGSFGVRFDETSFSATDPVYGHYTSVREVEDGLLASGTLASEGGTKITFNDYYRKLSDRVTVERMFTVTDIGYELGFMVEQKWTDCSQGNIYDKEWFIPSNFYVNGSHDFGKSYARTYFNGNLLMVPADSASALLVSSYKDKFSFSMLDRCSGYRETTVDDISTVDGNYLYINEGFNFAGIELTNEASSNVSFNFVYPSYSNRQLDCFTYRMLPVELGLTRHLTYDLFFNEYETYENMYVSNWRKAYDSFSYVDKRYDLNEVYQTLLDYIKKSYSAKNAWGDVPQFMTLSDHYIPDSGFLYRNLEMGMFMLKYGYEKGDQQLIQNALTVINYQIDNDCIDKSMRAYPRENSVFKRVLFDGLASVVDLYEFLLTSTYENKALEEKLFNYISTKAELYKNDESLLSISFYSRLYRLKNVIFLNYDSVAIALGDKIIESIKEYNGYYGAIENDMDLLSCVEDYMLFLRGFMNLYERNYEQKYLKECVHIANYLETFNVIAPINMNPIGSTGAELTTSDNINDLYFHSGFVGNERFLGYGYAYNNTNHGILDCPTSSTVVEYFKLFQYTGDSHYKDFAEMKFINSLLYVNMGDKVGYMDDPLHSSGEGFINEFAGNTTVRDNYTDGGIRGAVHDACIGWNIYELLYGFDYLTSIFYEGFYDHSPLTHNLIRNKNILTEGNDLIHGQYLIKDGFEDTYFMANNDEEIVIDLNEQCHIESIFLGSTGSFNVSISNDNVSYESLLNSGPINVIARYVKINAKKGDKIFETEINGYPVKYENLAPSAEVISGDKNAIDKSNYNTVWNAGSSDKEAELIIDLGEKHQIYETAIKLKDVCCLKYKVEVSDDGENYTLFGSDSGDEKKFVFVNEGFIEGRYVKLTLESSSAQTYMVKDFKVLGH